MGVADLPVHDIPALNGNNAPVQQEDHWDDLEVIGEVPQDMNGLYVRNGPNSYYQPEWRYHAYDGDGMLHAVHFNKGKVSYRNKWVRTDGLVEEQRAGQSLWKGLKEAPRADTPDQPLKNTANTDVKFHAGRLVAMWYRSGLPYAVDPASLDTVGSVDVESRIDRISAHSRPDEHSGEFMFFDYDTKPPYMRYGVVDANRNLRHLIDVPMDRPGLPHDMAITDHYSILHDFPLRPDPEALKLGRYKVRFFADQPSRFAVIPRYGNASDIRWFDAKPTYMLHVVNAWEEGSEVVMVGTPYRMHTKEDGSLDAARLEKTIHLRQRDFQLYEWRFNLETGKTSERVIDDVLNTEFPIINSAYQGRKNRWSYHVIFPQGGREEPRFPGLVKYDLETGGYIAYSAGPQYFYNEAGFAPRDNATSEDDGYLVMFVWNPGTSQSEVQIFDAKDSRMAQGPIARVLLPRRVPHGFHATYVSQANLDKWK
ncbi:MAG: carotenoid oxygenase family protein [Burkholderiaceae bacterium]|jgi:carotenoid cleavage dioxygenase|nr:carotenoid oxygenase family protein [Burkholderiaceae bacterium]